MNPRTGIRKDPIDYDDDRPPRRRSRIAVWSAALAVSGLFVLGWLLGILAIWLGIRGQRDANVSTGIGARGVATLGLVLGVVDLLMWTAAHAWFKVFI